MAHEPPQVCAAPDLAARDPIVCSLEVKTSIAGPNPHKNLFKQTVQMLFRNKVLQEYHGYTFPVDFYFDHHPAVLRVLVSCTTTHGKSSCDIEFENIEDFVPLGIFAEVKTYTVVAVRGVVTKIERMHRNAS